MPAAQAQRAKDEDVSQGLIGAPPPGSRPRPRPFSKRVLLWIGAFLVVATAPLLVLHLGDMPPAVGFVWDFSMGLGFAGLALMGLQFALTARFRRASSPFGIDVIYVLHQYLAWLALAFVASHFGLLWLFHQDALGVLDPRHARWELTFGRAALLLFGLAVVTSQWRKWLRLEYGLWRYLHVAFATLGFAAAIAHVLGVGRYTSHAITAALWILLTLSWFAVLVWVRLGKPIAQLRNRYRVAELREEAGDTVTLVLEPDGHPGFKRFKPGQFVWITLGSSPFLLREHPFSIASGPEELPRMSFGIKALGDFTKSLRNIQPGRTAYLDGPYGVFSVDDHPDADGYVFIVGGIGVTPVLSMLRSLAARGDGRPLWLFYANTAEDNIVYRKEIEALSGRLHLRVVHILAEAPNDWTGEVGYLTREILERHLPADLDGLWFFLCGPRPMTRAAEAALDDLGVPAERVRSEIFELV